MKVLKEIPYEEIICPYLGMGYTGDINVMPQTPDTLAAQKTAL